MAGFSLFRSGHLICNSEKIFSFSGFQITSKTMDGNCKLFVDHFTYFRVVLDWVWLRHILGHTPQLVSHHFLLFFFLYRFQNVFWYIFVAVCFPLSVYLRGVSWDVLVIRIPESMHCCFLSRALFVGPAFGKIRIFKSPQEARYGAGGMISEGRPLSNTSPWFSWQDRTGKCVGPKALEPAA